MLSYRHAFHAGNHADVLKHLCVVAVLRYLTQAKDTALLVADTHAGAGWYRLDGEQARTSAEAAQGVLRLWQAFAAVRSAQPQALRAYLDVLAQCQAQGDEAVLLRNYPGSPAIARMLLRAHDVLHLCERHPADKRLLARHMAQGAQALRVHVSLGDGFELPKSLLPPRARRALVLIDPSYEIKTDYAQVAQTLAHALERFATGCYLLWYPVIALPQAHALPRRLQRLAQEARRGWLQASLSTGRGPVDAQGRDGLRASGVFIVNPPHVLAAELRAALPLVCRTLQRGPGAGWQVQTGGGA